MNESSHAWDDNNINNIVNSAITIQPTKTICKMSAHTFLWNCNRTPTDISHIKCAQMYGIYNVERLKWRIQIHSANKYYSFHFVSFRFAFVFALLFFWCWNKSYSVAVYSFLFWLDIFFFSLIFCLCLSLCVCDFTRNSVVPLENWCHFH